jgi:MtrB/PioB family decaheme-associated outer membrane protein
MAASGADDSDDVAALVQPTNTVEVGAGHNSAESAKFGEYSGLTHKGFDLVANFRLRGGDAYGQGDGTMRYGATGIDLGTDSRDLSGYIVNQGHWRLGFDADSISHAFTDTYQTPLVGSMGGNTFIMPPAFGVVSTASKGTPYGTQALTQAQQAFFHTEAIESNRDTITASGGVDFDDHWNIRVSVSNVAQSGAKPLSSATDGNLSARGATLAGYSPGKEAIQLIMNPTNYETQNLNAAVNWVGEKAFATFSLFGSNFRDRYQSVEFSNPYTSANVANGSLLGAAFPVDALSTAPNSDVYQFGLSGGYNFTRTTRLVGSLSRSTNTQNALFVNLDQMQPDGLPRSALGGQVITSHADLKLTDRSIGNLNLTAGFKYNERRNETASATYRFFDLGAGAETSVSTPMSNKRTQAELAADYRVANDQTLHLGYEYEQFERFCLDARANDAQGSLSTTNAGYYTTASCAQVPKSSEDKISAGYRLRAQSELQFNVGVGYADRKSTVNPSFYNPMQANSQGFENYGYVAFFQASRHELSAKAGVDWQATSKLDVNLSGRVLKDDYVDSALGVQNSKGASANLDATYELSEKASIAAFATWQNRTRDLLTANGRNAVAPLTTLWTNELADRATTLGITARQGGLANGRLEWRGDILYSLGKTAQSTAIDYTNTCTTPGNAGFACGPLPDIRSQLFQFQLSGTYDVTKQTSVALGYQFQRLVADDYLYNYYQIGYTGTTTMPTNQQGPGYTQNRIVVTYRYSFR